MAERHVDENFNCPRCNARYKLVRMPAQVHSRYASLHCKICQQELPAIEDGSILKYFFVGHSAKPGIAKRLAKSEV